MTDNTTPPKPDFSEQLLAFDKITTDTIASVGKVMEQITGDEVLGDEEVKAGIAMAQLTATLALVHAIRAGAMTIAIPITLLRRAVEANTAARKDEQS